MFDEEFDKMPEPKKYIALSIVLDPYHIILFCGENSDAISTEFVKRWNEYPELVRDIGKRESKIIDLTTKIEQLKTALAKAKLTS